MLSAHPHANPLPFTRSSTSTQRSHAPTFIWMSLPKIWRLSTHTAWPFPKQQVKISLPKWRTLCTPTESRWWMVEIRWDMLRSWIKSAMPRIGVSPTGRMSQKRKFLRKPCSSAAWMRKNMPNLHWLSAAAQIWNGCCLMSGGGFTTHKKPAGKDCSSKLPVPRALQQAAAMKMLRGTLENALLFAAPVFSQATWQQGEGYSWL